MKRKSLAIWFYCTLAAALLWLFYNLSNEYSSYFRFSVQVKSEMEGHALYSTNRSPLSVRVKARGFTIVRHMLRKEGVPLLLEVENNDMIPYAGTGEWFYVLTTNVQSLINEALGVDVYLEAPVTDTLKVFLPFEMHKKVPVSLQLEVNYDPQYMSFTPPIFTPDSVVVYGPKAYLQRVDSVFTNKVVLDDLAQGTDGVVRVEVPSGTRLSHREVAYHVDATRYVELTQVVNLEARNVPSRRELLLLPDRVTVRFRVPYSDALQEAQTSMFTLLVDYNDFKKSRSGRVAPVIDRRPVEVSHIRLLPPFIDVIDQPAK